MLRNSDHEVQAQLQAALRTPRGGAMVLLQELEALGYREGQNLLGRADHIIQ